jgi:hypothetical protein
MKSRRMRWPGTVDCMGEIRNAQKILQLENMKGRDNLGSLYVDGKTILKWILNGI